MRRIAYLSLILFICMNLSAFGGERVIFQDNEYGGITEKITYSKEDAEYKEGFYKKTVSYDKKGNPKSIELYATKAHTDEQGWYRSITYFWGKTKIGEVYATDSHAEEYGFHKMVVYLDTDEKVSKREYILREDTVGAKQGIYKRVIHYDSDGRRTKAINLDKLGNVVKTK